MAYKRYKKFDSDSIAFRYMTGYIKSITFDDTNDTWSSKVIEDKSRPPLGNWWKWGSGDPDDPQVLQPDSDYPCGHPFPPECLPSDTPCFDHDLQKWLEELKFYAELYDIPWFPPEVWKRIHQNPLLYYIWMKILYLSGQFPPNPTVIQRWLLRLLHELERDCPQCRQWIWHILFKLKILRRGGNIPNRSCCDTPPPPFWSRPCNPPCDPPYAWMPNPIDRRKEIPNPDCVDDNGNQIPGCEPKNIPNPNRDKPFPHPLRPGCPPGFTEPCVPGPNPLLLPFWDPNEPGSPNIPGGEWPLYPGVEDPGSPFSAPSGLPTRPPGPGWPMPFPKNPWWAPYPKMPKNSPCEPTITFEPCDPCVTEK